MAWRATSPPSRAFRVPVRTGRVGRPRLVLPDGFLLGQVVKRSAQRHVVGVVHRVGCGTPAVIAAALAATHGGTVLNTAYIERLNATFRARLAPLFDGGAPSPTPRRCSRRACIWWGAPTIGAGTTTACAS